MKETNDTPKELEDKFKLWTLRMILKADVTREYQDENFIFFSPQKKRVTQFLGLEKYACTNSKEFDKKEVMQVLQTQLIALEKKKEITTLPVLEKNIKQLSKELSLSPIEEQVLEFCILGNAYNFLSGQVANMLGYQLNTAQVLKALSIILGIPILDIKDALQPNATLISHGIIGFDYTGIKPLAFKINMRGYYKFSSA